MYLLELSMSPLNQGESVSAYVSRVIAMIRDSGVSYQLTPMGTVIETDQIDTAFKIVKQAYDILDEAGSKRVYAAMKLDIRKGRDQRIKGKVNSIWEKIGQVST